jgi:hypothetical protein
VEARDDGADIDLHCRDAVLSLAERAERRDYWGNRPCDCVRANGVKKYTRCYFDGLFSVYFFYTVCDFTPCGCEWSNGT